MLGNEHKLTISSVDSLAAFLHAKEQFQESAALFRESLEWSRAQLGKMHADTIRSITNLGQLQEAEQLFREELEKCREILGDDHEETENCIRNLAELLEEMGQVDEAARLRAEVPDSEGEEEEEDGEEP